MAHGLVEGQARAEPCSRRIQASWVNSSMVACRVWPGMLRRAKHHQLIFDPGLHFDVRVAAVAFD
jgi:hypothetical protein